MSSCIDTLDPTEQPPPILCDSNHCNGFQQTSAFHRVCNCRDWHNNVIPDCSPKDNLYPVQTGQCRDGNGNYQPYNSDDCFNHGMRWQTCFCCCSCFASSTPVAVPGGMRAIGDFNVGDLVLAAAKSGSGWAWKPCVVQHSGGSPAVTIDKDDKDKDKKGNTMFYIAYGDDRQLIATPTQLFLLAGSGKLKRADQLIPGTDQLVSAAGGSVAISKIQSGLYLGAVHHIATDVPSVKDFNGSIDNHLINANGVICGDFLLQLYQDDPKMQPNMANAVAPVVGTPAYRRQNPGLHATAFVTAVNAAAAASPITARHFEPHSVSETLIPEDAVTLFPVDQERQLSDPDIHKRPVSDPTNKDVVTYYSRLFSAFYPDVRFYLDWANTRPNVFAFNEWGQKTVVISGEFARMADLHKGAMAIALAFGTGCLTGDPTASLPAEQALYYGMSVSARSALQTGTLWNDTMMAGNQELGKVIKALIAKNAEDEKEDDNEELRCLLTVMTAAISGDELPTCAGGPTENSLKVVSAKYDTAGKQLVVTFNVAVSPLTANAVRNYVLMPAADISAAAIDPHNPAAVVLAAALDAGSYTLTVANMRAADGSTLDPDGCTASLSVAPLPPPAAGGTQQTMVA